MTTKDKQIKVDEFEYHLPSELIAQQPSEKRELSKMMVLNRQDKSIEDKYFNDILEYIQGGDVLVINNTKVIPARVFGKKETGAIIEIFLIRNIENNIWQCLLRPQKRIKPEMNITLKNNTQVKVLEKDNENKWLIETPDNFYDELINIGNMPLPPYIRRERENKFETKDKLRYQTVYAKEPGAVAAPTAGLHFTEEIITKLKEKEVKLAEVTLHVGLGTFKPVQTEYIEDHIMHSEYYSLSDETAEIINQQKAKGKKIIPVGTTSIRTLETIAQNNNGKIIPSSGWSNIFIYPGYQFQIVDACITNFHLPKSTLIMLVSALAGKDFIFKAYQHAIDNKYRFYSYGDCMLIK